MCMARLLHVDAIVNKMDDHIKMDVGKKEIRIEEDEIIESNVLLLLLRWH